MNTSASGDETSLAPRGGARSEGDTRLSHPPPGLSTCPRLFTTLKSPGLARSHGRCPRKMTVCCTDGGVVHKFCSLYGLARGPGVPRPPLTRANEVLTAWSARPTSSADPVRSTASCRSVGQRGGVEWFLDPSLCVAPQGGCRRGSAKSIDLARLGIDGRRERSSPCAAAALTGGFHEHVLQGPRASGAGSSAAPPDGAVGASEWAESGLLG